MEDKTIKLLLLIPIYAFIIIAAFVAYNQYNLQQKLGSNSCYTCALQYSKSCTFQAPDQAIRDDPAQLKAYLTAMAEDNAQVSKTTDYSYLQSPKILTDLNISLAK